MAKQSDHERAKNGAHLTILNLSIWRLGFPLLGALMWNIPGIVVGVAAGLLCHVVVRPYISVNPFRLKQLADESQFVKLKSWMVPGATKMVDASCYFHVEAEVSGQSKALLKDVASRKGHITYLDYVNAVLLDEQLWARIEASHKNKRAVKIFTRS